MVERLPVTVMSAYPESLIPNILLKDILDSEVTHAIARGYEGFAEARTIPGYESGESAFQVKNGLQLDIAAVQKDSAYDFFGLTLSTLIIKLRLGG
jgi:hypothetical protein